ncbi:MAG: hypothetical protein HY721_22005 [Planctomycetes bacterium]|nr:hypothetical protein [Planctomycetota bacterium]
MLRHLATREGRTGVLPILRRLGVSKVFLEGRRGDEHVPVEILRAARDHFRTESFEVAGGIATVPGSGWGVRQNENLGWLNYEAEKTRSDIRQFFAESSAIFDELIVDDFYCTADTSPASEKARGARPWAEYRQELLVSLLEPMIVGPTRAVRPSVRLILKFPQWYDRFHLFGYDPVRMPPAFDSVWVGTEVRNPETQRMGFVQPFQGYVNFRWLSSAAGSKVEGAWFDHIDCTAQNFLDQAFQSVLAGARALTLFRLGDLVEGHPGHALLEAALPELAALAAKVRDRSPRGISYYKPPGSDAEENLYLMDYLALIGLPIVPEARYPDDALVAILGAQAAADRQLIDRMRRHLARGATLILTPALVRCAGASVTRLAGVRVSERPEPGVATGIEIGPTGAGQSPVPLTAGLEIDLGLESESAQVRMEAVASGRRVPWLTARDAGGGNLLVWNIRTFSEQDFREVGEWLLPPKPRGLPEIPQELADEVRGVLLAPLGLRLSTPTRVGFYLFGAAGCLYNFRDRPVEVVLDGETLRLGPNRWLWRGR